VQFLVPNYRVTLAEGELRIFCGCGASADLGQSAEAGRTVWGYVCSKDGDAVTDFVDDGELAAFQRRWRNEITGAKADS
jgi:hypothetical protein